MPGVSSVPDGTVVELQGADGTAVLNAEELPVSTPVAPDGTFIFETEQRPASDPYQLTVVPPDGFQAPDPVLVVADSATPTPAVITMAAVAVLAVSGISVAPALAGGLLLVAL